MNGSSQNTLMSISLACLIISFASVQYNSVYGQNQNQTSIKDGLSNIAKSIGGIQCDKVEHLVFHNHTKLIIKIQNKTQTVPAGIGIFPNDCIFWLHTHDDSGIIHIESPVKQAYTLGQFLNIWKSFDNSPSVGSLSTVVSSGNVTRVYVDGIPNNASSIDLGSIPLKDKSVISLDIPNMPKG